MDKYVLWIANVLPSINRVSLLYGRVYVLTQCAHFPFTTPINACRVHVLTSARIFRLLPLSVRSVFTCSPVRAFSVYYPHQWRPVF